MTKRKIAITVLVVIIAAIVATVVSCIFIANSKNDDSKPTAELADWMSMIDDDALLKKIAIPGAHDAGTKGMPYFAETQDRGIADLLNCGTRYLDLRVSHANGKLLIYHGPSKGVALTSVLDDVKQFLTDHPTETLLLDFQHFEEENHEAQDAVLQLLRDTLWNDGLLLPSQGSLQNENSEFMNKVTLKEVRGKAIPFWGTEDGYFFMRTDDEGFRDYSSLHSFYYGALHKKDSKTFIKTALPQYLEKWRTEDWQSNEGLFVLQGQLTDGLYVFGPRFREATHTKNMDAFVEKLSSTNYLDIVNIVMRDFVTPHKNCVTLKLNVDKQLVKADMRATYDKMLTDNMK